jgi:DNA-binding NarL/FixJ family response regulator
MPFMGVVELSQKVIDAIPTFKVLFASGYSDEQTLSNVLAPKDHHFIQKLFTPYVLAGSVREIFDA